MPIVSVIICTYNRCEILAETLSSFGNLDVARVEDVELVIVDNKSTDSTKRIVSEYISRTGKVARYVHEPKQGLSYARNSGIEQAQGDIIAFVDDDIYFDKGWLTALISAFDQHPQASAMGGRSIPLFEGGRPHWMKDCFLSIYGDTNFGDRPLWLTYPQHPFGLNMAFRRNVFEEIGRFDPNLGRKKKSLLSNEESELFLRIFSSNAQVFYEPDAILFHRIPRSRIDQNWLLQRFYWQGISDVVLSQIKDKRGRLTLLSEGIKTLYKAFRKIRREDLSPRKIYWNYVGLNIESRANLHYLLGKARQEVISAFSR